MWTYRCYNDSSAPNLWRNWYDNNPDYQGSHDSVFGMLEQQDQWREPHAKILDKNNGIIEVRLTGIVRHRVLGFYGSVRREFIVVATCHHKGEVYTPKNIRKTAAERRKRIEADIGEAPSCERPY